MDNSHTKWWMDKLMNFNPVEALGQNFQQAFVKPTAQAMQDMTHVNPVENASNYLHTQGIDTSIQKAKNNPQQFATPPNLNNSVLLNTAKNVGQKFNTEFLQPTEQGINFLRNKLGGQATQDIYQKQGLTPEQAKIASELGSGLMGTVGEIGNIAKNIDARDVNVMTKFIDSVRLRKPMSKAFTQHIQNTIEAMGLNPHIKNDALANKFEQILQEFQKTKGGFTQRPIAKSLPTDTFAKSYKKFMKK